MLILEPESVGARMRAAASDSGLSAEEIARELGVRPQTIYRWWTDQRVPEGDWLRRYAALVRRPVSYFYAQDKLTELAGFLKEFADLVMCGEEPPVAWDQLTGRPDALSSADRRRLAARARQIREYLDAVAPNWALLSDDEKQEVAAGLARQLQNRPIGR